VALVLFVAVVVIFFAAVVVRLIGPVNDNVSVTRIAATDAGRSMNRAE